MSVFTLELNQADYEELLKLPAHLVIVISNDGKFLKSNIGATKILGWDPKEIVGKAINDFIHEEDRAGATEKINNLLIGQEISIGLNIRCLSSNGQYLWTSWTAISKEGQIFAMGSDITKIVETENALLEQKTRFKTFFEQSPLPMLILSLDGMALAVNQAWENLYQTSRMELKNYSIMKDPHVKNTFLESFLRRAFQGEQVEIPAFLYDPALAGKKGRPRWIESWISPVKDENGSIREIAMILKDVTEKMQTEQALIQSISQLKEAEEKFKLISDRFSMAVKAGNIGIWEWIPETGHLSWDETTERIYGYEPGEFPRSTEAFTDAIYPSDRKTFWDITNKAIEEKKPYTIDHRIIRQDGALRWLQGSGMAFYNQEGKPYHMMGTVIDITDRVQAEADQKFLSQTSEILNVSLDHREILRALCSHAINYFCDGAFVDQLLPDGRLKRLIVVHPDPKIVEKTFSMDANLPLHYTNAKLNPLITGKALFLEHNDSFWKKIRMLHGDDYYQAALSIEKKSSIRVRLKGRGSVLGLITFFSSKSSHKELTKRHIWLSEELAYRASMAFENALIHQSSQEAIRSRDEFLSIASHELKTPLQSLTLQNQMRKRNIDKKLLELTPEKMNQMIDADLRHLTRINRLIDDMLDISRIKAGKLTFINQKVEFCSFVKDVLDRFRPQLDSAGCYLYVNLSSEIMTNIDIYRMEQVIVNLLTNAMKYGAGKPIKVEVIKFKNRVQLHVIDNGPGIREQDCERIFQRFERAISSNEVSGLGLGLYISRQIMKQNNGKLFVKSIIGKGSTFVMELPFEQ